MAPNDSQAPDILDVEHSIIRLLPAVHSAVLYACRVYHHRTNQDEIKDLYQDVIVLLIENDYRVLRSLANRSSIETWLYTIVRRNVRLYLWKRRWEKENVSNVDDLSPDALSYQPTQEKTLIDEDEWKALISRLPDRKRLLLELVFLGLKSGEIAKEMGIKIGYVYRKRSALFKELRKLLEGRQTL